MKRFGERLFGQIRAAVTHKKHHHYEGDVAMDLSYITDQIIAMGFPGNGIQIAYRNDIEVIARFLQDHHEGKYLVFNLSGVPYDYSRLNHRVRDYGFPDHHPPPLELLFRIVDAIDMHLHTEGNIVVIHCLAGKGRTGTVIASYLFAKSLDLQSANEALQFFGDRRMAHGGGVEMPSQRRYVHYFAHCLLRNPVSRAPVYLSRLLLHGVPRFSKRGCTPYCVILMGDTQIFSSIVTSQVREYSADEHAAITIPLRVAVHGDVLLRCFHHPASRVAVGKGDTLMFRCSFHTGFLRPGVWRLTQWDLDEAHKDKEHKRFPPSFRAELHVESAEGKAPPPAQYSWGSLQEELSAQLVDELPPSPAVPPSDNGDDAEHPQAHVVLSARDPSELPCSTSVPTHASTPTPTPIPTPTPTTPFPLLSTAPSPGAEAAPSGTEGAGDTESSPAGAPPASSMPCSYTVETRATGAERVVGDESPMVSLSVSAMVSDPPPMPPAPRQESPGLEQEQEQGPGAGHSEEESSEEESEDVVEEEEASKATEEEDMELRNGTSPEERASALVSPSSVSPAAAASASVSTSVSDASPPVSPPRRSRRAQSRAAESLAAHLDRLSVIDIEPAPADPKPPLRKRHSTRSRRRVDDPFAPLCVSTASPAGPSRPTLDAPSPAEGTPPTIDLRPTPAHEMEGTPAERPRRRKKKKPMYRGIFG